VAVFTNVQRRSVAHGMLRLWRADEESPQRHRSQLERPYSDLSRLEAWVCRACGEQAYEPDDARLMQNLIRATELDAEQPERNERRGKSRIFSGSAIRLFTI